LLDVLVKNKIENDKPINVKNNILLNASHAKNVEVSQQLQISNINAENLKDPLPSEEVDESQNLLKRQSPQRQKVVKESVEQQAKSVVIPEQVADDQLVILKQGDNVQLNVQKGSILVDKEPLVVKNNADDNKINLEIKKVEKPVLKENKDIPQDLR